MKKLTLPLLFFLFVINIFGQSELITREKYDEVINEANSKAQKLPHRKTMIANFYSGKNITQIRTTINEKISTEKIRNYFKVEQHGKITDLIENITIGNIQYRKKLNEEWTKIEISSSEISGRGGGLGTPIESKNLDEYFYTKSKINNQEQNLYVHFNVILMENALYFLEDKKWINSDGLIIKSVVKVSKIIPENITSISTTEYEYNPKDLKIEAPINYEKQKP